MLWEVEIQPRGDDTERVRIAAEYDLLTHGHEGTDLIQRTSRGYVLEGNLSAADAERLCKELLVDAVVETGRLTALDASPHANGSVTDGRPISPAVLATTNDLAGAAGRRTTVLHKPGVMDPVAQSVLDAARDLGLALEAARTFRRYYFDPRHVRFPLNQHHSALARTLANDAVDRIVEGPLGPEHFALGAPCLFRRIIVPIRALDEAHLSNLSREGQLSLSLAEMQAIQGHFRSLGREPTDVELETLAQTWSEHCSHKTLKGKIDFDGRLIDNLLKETIFGATQEIRRRLGADDWCVSVFEDNAGVVKFDDRHHVCFKVETHNHPSAIEPYGGANTGLGGVIRDPLGTGLGAKPICNTDVFCFAPPDAEPDSLPPGVLHPRKVMKGVVAGVRDYGNRMGIPTVNGAVCFDERYLANPLVFCGTVGLIPVERSRKEPKAGDLIVAVGGRTGRDGIHGATFSSAELTAESDRVSGGAVQIGNAITEKKMLDVLLAARDQGLYHAITDCGAGGFSSAVGEMGEKLGAVVHLDRAPLKYEGLSYTEIWISEAQERMILAVPPDHWPRLQALCASEDVEATAIGTFEPTGRLRLFYQDQQVADLDMHFLHEGRPAVVRKATWSPLPVPTVARPRKQDHTQDVLNILASLDVCSKEWIIRQYDHEVQGGSVIKPLVGVRNEGPGDAAVVAPVLGSENGLAIGCGIQPRYGDLDPYWMAAAAIDEAVRNVVAVGADPSRIALLDNFCWGNTERPETLGSLVRAAQACRDVALAFSMPFISGKDSLNNEYHSGGRNIAIPPTLLISAIGRVPDVRRCVTMDLKEPGNTLFLVGITREELGGSHYHLVNRLEGGAVPRLDLAGAPAIFRSLHHAIRLGLVRSCHDLSEGGLAIALAEMAFAGGIGADVTDTGRAFGLNADDALLFSESTTRFVVEVRPDKVSAFQECLRDVPLTRLGHTCKEQRLRIAGLEGEWIVWANLKDLQEAWQKPLRW
jgi:phosphoribosylformylglycinamidine synthase